MQTRNLLSILLIAATIASGCLRAVKDSPPYESPTGLSFEIDDGTGVFYSQSKTYKPVYCGREYPIRHLDIGQTSFNQIERLVDDGDLWSTHVQRDTNCREIDPAPDIETYRFMRGSVTKEIRIDQCQVLPTRQAAYLKQIRQIIRAASDTQKLRVGFECIRF